MCWIGKFKLQTAIEDIPIFKIVRKPYSSTHVKSVYTRFRYDLNYLYKLGNYKITAIDYVEGDEESEVDLAFHSYNPDLVSVTITGGIIFIRSTNREDINNTPSFGRSLDYFTFIQSIVKAEGFIPKGAQYCMNENGEYISNEIVLTKVIKL